MGFQHSRWEKLAWKASCQTVPGQLSDRMFINQRDKTLFYQKGRITKRSRIPVNCISLEPGGFRVGLMARRLGLIIKYLVCPLVRFKSTILN